MEIIDKILQVAKRKKVSVTKIHKHLGFSRATFYNKKDRGDFTIAEIHKLADLLDIDIASLFEGESDYVRGIKVPIKAQAGVLLNGGDIQVMEHELEYVFLPKSMVRVSRPIIFEAYGDSMYPEIVEGENVVCEEVKDETFLRKGKMYVVITKTDIIIKYLKSYDKKQIVLGSENEAYTDIVVKREEITKIFAVIGKYKCYE